MLCGNAYDHAYGHIYGHIYNHNQSRMYSVPQVIFRT
jgi:hypothetical protein